MHSRPGFQKNQAISVNSLTLLSAKGYADFWLRLIKPEKYDASSAYCLLNVGKSETYLVLPTKMKGLEIPCP